MRKQFALICGCIIALAYVIGGQPEKRPVPGYQTANDTQIHYCKKGWHRDSNSRSCVRD
jgi:hypothetical protein